MRPEDKYVCLIIRDSAYKTKYFPTSLENQTTYRNSDPSTYVSTVQYLLEKGFTPERDIYISLGHDEENSGIEGNSMVAKSLKKEGMLTRDSREVERKKYGQPGARKKFQFSKR